MKEVILAKIDAAFADMFHNTAVSRNTEAINVLIERKEKLKTEVSALIDADTNEEKE